MNYVWPKSPFAPTGRSCPKCGHAMYKECLYNGRKGSGYWEMCEKCFYGRLVILNGASTKDAIKKAEDIVAVAEEHHIKRSKSKSKKNNYPISKRRSKRKKPAAV